MPLFNMRDIFAVAIKIEERGEAFYRDVARQVNQESVQKLFIQLANDEVEHKRLFQQMAQQVGGIELNPEAQKEFLSYLDAYTESLIFEEPEKLPYNAQKAFDLPRALIYAIEKELDSVLFYKEVKELVPPSEQGLLDQIITEERRHVVNLSWLKKQLIA